ncbi:swi5-like zinc finger protein, partial [Coemansia sp. RSA 2322]
AELAETISALRRELEAQVKARDELLSDSSKMSVEQARLATNEHIDRLHRYNDIKDAGQVLFGKLAELQGKTVKEVYEEYGVDLAD